LKKKFKKKLTFFLITATQKVVREFFNI